MKVLPPFDSVFIFNSHAHRIFQVETPEGVAVDAVKESPLQSAGHCEQLKKWLEGIKCLPN
jgi:hypothetical protein